MPDVELRVEWSKLVINDGERPISRTRWLMWAMRARLDRTNQPVSAQPDPAAPPADERQQRQARDWVKRGFWLRDGSWGPAPDQPGCSLPPGLIAWCLRERGPAVKGGKHV